MGVAVAVGELDWGGGLSGHVLTFGPLDCGVGSISHVGRRVGIGQA